MFNNHFFLFLLLIGSTSLSAQITLTADNYGSRDTVILADTSYIDTVLFATPPSAGADQIWDYSGRTLDPTPGIFDQRPVGEDTCFADASAVSDITLDFQGFPYPAQDYEGTDETGRYLLGTKIPEASFSLLQVTGNPNDTLTFPANVIRERFAYINFPATFGDSFADTLTTAGIFQLTVAAFGLNGTPGSRDITSVTLRDVIGYGTLTLPQGDGSTTEPLEALLVRDSVVTTTTYSLGGAPAPAALLGAFGLTDTTVYGRSIYYFHVKGRGRSVARFSPRTGADDGKYALIVRNIAPGTTTSVRNHDLLDLALSPNPVRPGGSIKLAGATAIDAGTMRLLDLQGRVISQVQYQGIGSGAPELHVPASARPGLYLYQLSDATGRPVGAGKVMVQ